MKEGFPVTSRVTINRHNVDDLENIATLLLDDLGLNSFGTNEAAPIGAGCSNYGEIVLTPDQQLTAMDKLDRLSKSYNGRINATAGPLARKRMYAEMTAARNLGK